MIKKRIGSIQYAALPFQVKDGMLSVMLITSRETHRWIIPKGWPIKGRSPSEAALQEAYEEAGIRGNIFPEPFACFGYLKRLDDGTSRNCTAYVYPLEVNDLLDEWPEKNQRKREWMAVEKAMACADDEGLAKILQEFPYQLSKAGKLAVQRSLSSSPPGSVLS